jgi:hypothetical protein
MKEQLKHYNSTGFEPAHQTKPMVLDALTDAKAHVFIIMQILLDHAICMDERKLLSI